MAWVVYTVQRLGYEDNPSLLIAVLEASGPRDPRARSSLWGIPILAAWLFDGAYRLW